MSKKITKKQLAVFLAGELRAVVIAANAVTPVGAYQVKDDELMSMIIEDAEIQEKIASIDLTDSINTTIVNNFRAEAIELLQSLQAQIRGEKEVAAPMIPKRPTPVAKPTVAVATPAATPAKPAAPANPAKPMASGTKPIARPAMPAKPGGVPAKPAAAAPVKSAPEPEEEENAEEGGEDAAEAILTALSEVKADIAKVASVGQVTAVMDVVGKLNARLDALEANVSQLANALLYMLNVKAVEGLPEGEEFNPEESLLAGLDEVPEGRDGLLAAMFPAE